MFFPLVQKTSPKSTPLRETEPPNSYCSWCQPPTAACMATPSLKWDLFQFSLKQMTAKWNCTSHHSDESQKELSQSRHAVLIYLVEDFSRIPLKWLMHCQKLKPELGGNHSPNSSPPLLGLNPPAKPIKKPDSCTPQLPHHLYSTAPKLSTAVGKDKEQKHIFAEGCTEGLCTCASSCCSASLQHELNTTWAARAVQPLGSSHSRGTPCCGKLSLVISFAV